MIDLLIKKLIKNYKNTGNPQVRENYGKLASIMGIATNLFLFSIKITVGLIFNSISIIADAVNNLSDSGASLVTLVGFKLSGKPADQDHPYGHERMENIAGLVVSFIILFLGLQLIQSSIGKIVAPELPQFSSITIVVLIIAILVKVWQFWFYQKIAKTIDSMTLLATATDSRNDIMATSAVLIAAMITFITGFDLDGYMGVVVAIFIVFSGINLVKETISPLLGSAPSKDLIDNIYQKILSYEHIIGLHDLIVHSYGATKIYASVHCEVPAELNCLVSHSVIDQIERDFLKEMDIHLIIHMDPVVIDDKETNDLKKQVETVILSISPDIHMHDFRVVWGFNHANIIFDVAVSYDFPWSNAELIQMISDEIYKINDSYHAVITVDHSNYVPNENDFEC
ncbi:cation diffusion facilitator family transporter [Acetobacterium woodii]|uniref:Cation diffusion facilitator family transporter n=1 Tax=Acetobacterium woodii (strain ATCC 29683 / DSM 1030 / JCM 2381 / KCTC 1655 / WB1) TaxID=931626 RepID=H6LHU2_ACEWD|nr:cation diffusion facilitator family transporter [Acetobacterium woodii]AFA48472.1 cation diffusion facilitator family transporter [Acetobacterium woodii DSM 1030]